MGDKASVLHGVRESERRAKRDGESESRGLFVGQQRERPAEGMLRGEKDLRLEF